MMRKTSVVAVGLGLVLVTGCAWVKLSPAGQGVKLVPATAVSGCRDIGKTTVKVLADVKGVHRNRDKVAAELQILGRNSAAEMGGDTMVTASDIMEGEQTFTVFRCGKP